MELDDALVKRKSTRAFLADPVPADLLEKVLNAGITAPSKGNSQIWEFYVVTGEKLKEMVQMLLGLLRTELIPAMKLADEESGTAAGEALEKAERRSGRNRLELEEILSPLGMSVEDFMLEGTFSFFGAPVAVLVMVDEVFARDLPHILSVGAAVENILLSAVEAGLGTCWIGGVWRYTKNIRSLLGIDDHMKLLSSIAIGYPDPDSPVSRYKSGRDDLGEFVQWIGFGDV